MSYLGNSPPSQNFVAGADQFSGTGSQTVFTLSRNVNTVFDMFVTVSNVPQDPFTAYTVAGNTLTFDGAPPAGTNNIDVVYRATNVQTFVPSPGVSPSVGNLNFIGTGNRITGDFSNATVANRVNFQTSTLNNGTYVSTLPNGTDTNSGFFAYNATNGDNAAFIGTYLNNSLAIVNSGKNGTGTFLPMTFYTGGSERMRIATDGVITSGLGGMQVISGTSVSASSTAVNFTGIPSWVKRITVMFDAVSLSGTSNYLIQLGAGSVTTTGYTSTCNNGAGTATTSTAGLLITVSSGAADLTSGLTTISNISSNTWVQNGVMNNNGTTRISAGKIALGGTLDRVRITTVNGTDTFDAGTINILYE